MNRDAAMMLHEIQTSLRTTAEQDPNDIIANSASDLSVRLETVGTTFGMALTDLTDVDRQLIQYALSQHPQMATAD